MNAERAYRVLYTRPEASPAFEQILREAGLEILRIPLIRIAPPETWDALDSALANISAYNGVILTSIQAVRWFAGRMKECTVAPEQLPPVYAVGAKTAGAAETEGFRVEPLPSVSYGKILAEEMAAVKGRRFLQPTSDIARDELVQVIRSRGGVVDQIVAYRTLPAEDVEYEQLRKEMASGVDCVAFFSPSAVLHFAEALPGWRQGDTLLAAIGTTTAEVIVNAGHVAGVIAEVQSAEALARAIAGAAGGWKQEAGGKN